jgi:hypothetical protein
MILPRSGYETHWWALAGAGGREYRSGREPGPRFGELVQFDGSPRAWFENRGPRCCLITMTGDAVKIRLSQFFEEATTAGAMTAAASPPNCHTG